MLSRGIWDDVTVVSLNSKMYNSAHNFGALCIAFVKSTGWRFGAPPTCLPTGHPTTMMSGDVGLIACLFMGRSFDFIYQTQSVVDLDD